jgi:hypothetical protein
MVVSASSSCRAIRATTAGDSAAPIKTIRYHPWISSFAAQKKK